MLAAQLESQNGSTMTDTLVVLFVALRRRRRRRDRLATEAEVEEGLRTIKLLGAEQASKRV